MKPVTKALALALGVLLSDAAISKEITVATWGGFYGQSIKKHLAEPFEKATGVKVNLIHGNSFANFQRIVAQRNSPQIDLVTLGVEVGYDGFERGVFEAIDPALLPNVHPKDKSLVRTSDGKIMLAPLQMLSYGILYNTKATPFAITSWNDLWDTRLRNKVGVTSPKHASSAFLLMMNRLAGGKESDTAPGFAKIKSLGENILVTEDAPVRQLQMLAQGEVWAVTTLSATAVSASQQGLAVKFVVPKEGAVGIVNNFALVKGAPNRSDAIAFLNFAYEPSRIKLAVEGMYGIPTDPRVELESGLAKLVGGTAEDRERMLFFDVGAIHNHRAKWIEMWEREVAPMTRR